MGNDSGSILCWYGSLLTRLLTAEIAYSNRVNFMCSRSQTSNMILWQRHSQDMRSCGFWWGSKQKRIVQWQVGSVSVYCKGVECHVTCVMAFQSASSIFKSGPGTSRHHWNIPLYKATLNPAKQQQKIVISFLGNFKKKKMWQWGFHIIFIAKKWRRLFRR